MSILVCGGAGYIGSATAHLLRAQGRDVVIYDNLSRGHAEAVEGFPLVVGDLYDSDLLDRTIKEYKVDAVLHFAAHSQVGESMHIPLEYYRNNVGATRNLLERMIENGVKRIVFSSTAATYGEPEHWPITEDSATNPTNAYGDTKLSIEKMLHWCHVAYGLQYTALRYFNACGAYSPDVGEAHSPETHLIPNVLRAALGEDKVLEIYGSDYPTKDGTCVRDYIHVTDLAEAHHLALVYLEKGGESDVFNLGNGNGFSNLEILETARRVTGKEIPAVMGPRRAGDPAILVASSEKARRVLGWDPSRDSLERIIGDAWAWHVKHPHGYGK